MGVCASWHPPASPRRDDVDADGLATWQYDFCAQNPGRFPVSSAELRVQFTLDVRRLRGENRADPIRDLVMVHPVLPGAGQRRWQRTLQMNYADAAVDLPNTTVSVSLRDASGVPYMTEWPSH